MYFDEENEYVEGNLDFTGITYEIVDEDADPWNDDERYEFVHQDDNQYSELDWGDQYD